ncbi:MAG: hypothetical protein IKH15_09495 [Bacteroidales bacterium]|nr:hypothetical protein [Bacteroidales bacterium]MBR4647592.1 hypothetical protein [Bacteroidales bacterium]
MGKSKIKVTEVTKKNLKEGQKVRIVPSANIIRLVVDTVARNGIAGEIIKGDDDKLYITATVNYIADAEEIIKCETVIEEK